MSIAIRANQNVNQQAATERAAEKNGNKGVVKSFYAGGLTLTNDKQSQIDARRNSAKKQAMKVIGDAWKKDTDALQNIEDMNGLKEQKLSEINDMKSKVRDIENTKKALQEEYGVADDSAEQKDLKLLEKYQNNMNGSSYDKFSEDELKRLKELQNTPLTEYQKKVLTLNGMQGEVNNEADRVQHEVNLLTGSISDATLEQLKSRGMEKATDAAGEILDSAEKEIFGMLIDEGKNKIDDDIKEEKEKAEEAADKKEEQDEKLEEAKEKRKEQEEVIQGQQDTDQLEQDISLNKQSATGVDEAQKNIQKILKDNHLVNEDIKGIEIDLNF